MNGIWICKTKHKSRVVTDLFIFSVWNCDQRKIGSERSEHNGTGILIKLQKKKTFYKIDR